MSKKSVAAEADRIHRRALKRLQRKDKNKSLFGVQLASVIAEEIAEADGDVGRLSEVIERLVTALGFAIAVASRGDPDTMDKALQAVDAQLYEVAAGCAKTSLTKEGAIKV